MDTPRHEAVVEAAARWAERDDRVRALLLNGSLARGEDDERSDLDFVVIAKRGRLEELWAARRSIAEGLCDRWGGFDEVPWQAPYTFSGFCTGPLKVDFFFQEDEPAVDPWLRDGFRVLVDADGLVDQLQARLGADPPVPGLTEFDAHAWDWLWGCHQKLRRAGQEWLVYVELVKFVETMLLTGFNVLSTAICGSVPGSPRSAGCRLPKSSPHRCCRYCAEPTGDKSAGAAR